MKLWIAAGIFLLTIGLLSLVRVGGAIVYSDKEVLVRLLVGPFRITILPRPKEKKSGRPKEKKTKGKQQVESPKESGGHKEVLTLVKELFPLVAQSAGKMKNKIRIDHLDVDLTAAASNPALAAIAFGSAHAALGMMIPLLENNFHVKERRFHAGVDFDQKTPSILIRAVITLTVGQIVVFGVYFGMQVLKILVGQKKKEMVVSS